MIVMVNSITVGDLPDPTKNAVSLITGGSCSLRDRYNPTAPHDSSESNDGPKYLASHSSRSQSYHAKLIIPVESNG